MGKSFFTAWALWQKLCFALACAIVVTALLGALKLLYQHWRLRKYTAVAEKERREQSIQRQMSQRRRHDEVPFGVRALESGIEVEGVWVSRPTTPENRSRQTSTTSISGYHLSRRSQDVDLEKQMPRAHDRTRSRSTGASIKPPSSGFDRAASAERLPSAPTSRDASPDGAITKPLRTRHPPCSYAKYSNHPYTNRHSSAQRTEEGLQAAQRASFEAIRRASTSEQEASSNSDDSSQSGNENEPISAAAPRLLTQPIPRPRKESVDFDLMNLHRVSQAAETGQLTPRVRRPGQSGDWSTVSLPATGAQPDYFSTRQKLPQTPSSTGSSPTNPFTTPKVDALPPAVRRSSMPDVTPFAQFCQTAPPSPRPSSQISGTQLRRTSDASTVYLSAPPSPIVQPTEHAPGKLGIAPLLAPALETPHYTMTKSSHTSEPSQPKRTSFEKRITSEVLRGQGSGFEILRPGSLHPTLPSEQPSEKARPAPPISLHNAYRSRSSSAGSTGRKLQKKSRRPSTDSETSSE